MSGSPGLHRLSSKVQNLQSPPLLHIWVTFSVKWNTSTAPRSEDTIAKKHRMTAATIVDDKERSFQKVGHVTGFPLRSSDCLFWDKIEYTVYTIFILRTLPIMNNVQYISRSITTWLSKPIGEDLKWKMLTESCCQSSPWIKHSRF